MKKQLKTEKICLHVDAYSHKTLLKYANHFYETTGLTVCKLTRKILNKQIKRDLNEQKNT
jgi:hypothetical protein